MASPEFEFIPPPEAPVYKPTWEEFQDALAYINKIRPVAEQFGICKIIPPPDWQPPFAVDVDNLKFTPRIQRLNELEAHTRIKLNFLDQIAKFWELQGSSLKIPVVEKKALDLYSLHKWVQEAGGVEAVNRNRGWNNIAILFGFPFNKNIGTQLKHLYTRILQPFDIFNKSKRVPKDDACCETDDPDYVAEPRDYKPHQIPSRMAGRIPDNEKNGRRSRRHPPGGTNADEEEACAEDTKELRSLQFKGPGPKMTEMDKEGKSKGRNRKSLYYDHDPLAKYICLNCGRGDAEEHMLLCDGCDDSYHTFCLLPSLNEIPKGDWRCPKCVAVEVSKPLEAFGFEQAQKLYSLQSFGEMADKFKQNYFNMPVHLVPLEMAEREFWRIVSSIDEDVTVEYGADLHTMDHGSGFPTEKSSNLMPADQEYARDSWNLNNLPVQEGSVLAHIACDISGMKVPWMYVGMCFSTFCWHNEDHWSYSINYLHWGEPKTWYGVPGGEAEKFENCMRAVAPELFESQPDLLHQLVTIMNPNILMKRDVPIVRCNQQAGEFVITFPRSYHAGFNQGYNFAEAVNFAPPDWLSIGRECVLHYSNLKRYCVFSHDELVCKMAASPESLDLTVAAATYQDMLKMVDTEKKLRKALLHWGVTSAEREAFELLPDDERQCDSCKTTCFLSAVTCPCSTSKLSCLRHYTELCSCPPSSHILRYRYTLDELPPLLQRLKERAESFDHWAALVKQALEAVPADKLELEELRGLLAAAEERRFPDSELLGGLLAAVAEADKCAAVAAHLAAKKVRTRTRGAAGGSGAGGGGASGGSGSADKSRLTLEELRLFYEQISSLACVIKEAAGVRALLDGVADLQAAVVAALNSSEAWMMKLGVEEEKMEAEKKLEDTKEGNDDMESKQGKSNTKKSKKKKVKSQLEEDDGVKKEKLEDGEEMKKEEPIKSDESEEASSEDEEEEEDDEPVQSEEIGKLVEACLSLDIEVPELQQLRQRLQQVTWLEEVEDALEEAAEAAAAAAASSTATAPTASLTAEGARRLLEASRSLPPHVRIEERRVHLHALVQDMRHHDACAAALLAHKQGTLEEAEAVLAEAGRVRGAHMPAVASLRDAVRRAKEWQARAAAICKTCTRHDITSDNGNAKDNTGDMTTKSETNATENKPSSSLDSTKTTATITTTTNGISTACSTLSNGTSATESTATTTSNTASSNGVADVSATPTPVPVLEAVEALMHRARPIPLKLPELAVLEEEAAAAQHWLDKTARIFLKKNSQHCSLIEVLVPRTEIGLLVSGSGGSGGKRGKRMKRDEMTSLQQAAQLLDVTPEHAANPALLVRAYKECEDREVKAIRALRAHNTSKVYNPLPSVAGSASPVAAAEEDLPASFCVCHKPATPDMLHCSVCCDRFHAGCVPAPPSARLNGGSGGGSGLAVTRFMCPSCHRSRRPRLDTILALLMALQKIHVRLCEAGALQCLTERAMAWQDRAQQLLHATELSHAMTALSAACSLLTRHATQAADSESSDCYTERLWSTQLGLEEKGGSGGGGGNSEHAYSTTKQNKDGGVGGKTAGGLSRAKITSLLASVSDGADKPLVVISLATRQKMRDLLMEGELLEVTLEENLHLWRLLQVAENPVSKISEIIVSLGSFGGNGEEKTKKSIMGKKRRSQDGSISGGTAGSGDPGSKAPKLPNKSPIKRVRLISGKSGEEGSPARKCMKKKANSTSKLPDSKKKVGTNVVKKNRLSTSQSNSNLGSPSSNTAIKGPQIKSNRKPNKQNNKPKKKGSKSGVGGSSSSDDEEVCAAQRCKQPVGSVDWVQCDGCNGWFHYLCVGLKQTDVREDEDYNCVKCCGPLRGEAS